MWIKVIDTNTECERLVNTSMIAYIEDNNQAYLSFVDGQRMTTDETYEEIKRKIWKDGDEHE